MFLSVSRRVKPVFKIRITILEEFDIVVSGIVAPEGLKTGLPADLVRSEWSR